MTNILLLALKFAILAAALIAVTLATYAFGVQTPLERPMKGRRGLKRARAMQRNPLFRLVEPLIRFVGSFVQPYKRKTRWEELQLKIAQAGDFLGFSPSEFVAFQIILAIICAGFALLLMPILDTGLRAVLIAAIFGAWLAGAQLREAGKARLKAVDRALPGAIDLASLCMSAGLDFMGAVRQLTQRSRTSDEPVYEEFEVMLHQLELGLTRRHALEDFARRCPTDAVKDFVGSVIQSEEKGNPLAEVLHIQAGMLRMRRSVTAEEAAARAGVLMMGPLMMIFVAILILVLGPFAISNMQSGF